MRDAVPPAGTGTPAADVYRRQGPFGSNDGQQVCVDSTCRRRAAPMNDADAILHAAEDVVTILRQHRVEAGTTLEKELSK